MKQHKKNAREHKHLNKHRRNTIDKNTKHTATHKQMHGKHTQHIHNKTRETSARHA